MHDTERYRTVFAAAHALQLEALEKWRQEHHKGFALHEALDSEAQAVTTTIEQKPRGNISVTVSVEGLRPWNDWQEWFLLQRVQKGVIIRQEAH